MTDKSQKNFKITEGESSILQPQHTPVKRSSFPIDYLSTTKKAQIPQAPPNSESDQPHTFQSKQIATLNQTQDQNEQMNPCSLIDQVNIIQVPIMIELACPQPEVIDESQKRCVFCQKEEVVSKRSLYQKNNQQINKSDLTLEKDKQDSQAQATLSASPQRRKGKVVKICNCDKWNHAHESCLISRTIYNQHKCKECGAKATFKTRRNYSYQVLRENFVKRRAQVIGIYWIFAGTLVGFFGYLGYFLYSMFMNGINMNFIIQFCSMLSMLMLLFYGLAFFLNSLEKLSIVEIASEITIQDNVLPAFSPDLQDQQGFEDYNNSQEDEKQLTDNQNLQSNQQIVEVTTMNQIEVTSPGNITPTILSPGLSLHQSFSQQMLIQHLKPSLNLTIPTIQEDIKTLSTIPNNNDKQEELQNDKQVSQIALRTPKRSVTVSEETSPVAKLHIAGLNYKQRPSGSCLKNSNGSKFSKGSSEAQNKRHQKQEQQTSNENNTHSSSSNEQKADEHQQNQEGNQDEKVFHPFESTGNRTCRFGGVSSTLQISSSIPATNQPSEEFKRGQNGFNYLQHSKRLQLHKALKSGGLFFTSFKTMNSLREDVKGVEMFSNKDITENAMSQSSPLEVINVGSE